ncbi:VOC family protein [Pseudovibrio flavus]|uniref:VOC family protein n=1 Tax=Pseudovibrio flavus TaxID=2529854 RepID=UPI00211CDA1D|nr:VOC family protein [Pseudovibrio flavus]
MSILGLDHIQTAIPVGEEDKARAFYSSLLGFKEVPKPVSLAGRGGLWLQGGSLSLHIGVEAEFKPAKKAHPAFLFSNLDEVRAQLEANDCLIKEDAPLPGYKRCFTQDPFGNRIELMQRV